MVSDGAAGLLGAVEVVFWPSLRQRWLVHRPQEAPGQGPIHAQAQVKAAFWQILDDSTADPGQLAVDAARRRAEAFADRDGTRDPAAVAGLLESLPELTRFLLLTCSYVKRPLPGRPRQ